MLTLTGSARIADTPEVKLAGAARIAEAVSLELTGFAVVRGQPNPRVAATDRRYSAQPIQRVTYAGVTRYGIT